jgi:site-specific recombinase XerD
MNSHNTLSGMSRGTGTCLDRYIESFEERLKARNYSPGTIKTYRSLIRRLAMIMEGSCVRPEDITVELAADLVRGEERKTREPHKCANIARRFTEHLIEIGVATAPQPTPKQIARETLRQDYEDYLRRQRGLSDRSIYHCWRLADRFLDHRFGNQDDDLQRITPDDIAAFLQHLTTRKPPYKDKTPPTHLRNFFQYLFKSGLIGVNLALGIPSIAQRYGARLPRYLQPEEVEALLAALPTDTPTGRRNYAMVLTLARLGLRACEVIAIQFDDIDWRAGELMVRGKGQRHDSVPIPPDVGAAIANYVRRDRVTASRALFVKERAPNGPFGDSQVLNAILKDAFARTGLKPPCKYVGSHVLRHSLATNLVRQGASLSEIGDMLRHRCRSSTMIYAKLDIEGLRSIAQSWPTAGDSQ